MAEGKILNLAYISFIDMIETIVNVAGSASARGILIRNAVKTGEKKILPKVSETDYASFEDFLDAIEKATNPITMIEGKASHMGDSVFGLEKCPYGDSIESYNIVSEEMPDNIAQSTEEYNKPSNITNQYRVGEGSGVSPFCSFHQPMRSAIAEKMTINGKKIKIYQLGCKSGAGKKGFADKWLQETGVSRDVVDKILDDHMCCYYLKQVE